MSDWVAGRRPEFSLNPDAGFAYPQTNLTGTNQRVIQAINAYGQKNNIDPFQPAGSMISMGEMQNVVDFVNAREASPDGMIYRTQNGQRLPVQPGTGTALTALGLNAREQQELAQMMIQMTAAKTSGIDTEAKRRYYRGEGSFRQPAEDVEFGVNIRSTAGGPKVSSPTRAAAIASVIDKGNAGKQRRAFRDAATNDVLLSLKRQAGEDASVAPGTTENAQGVAYGSPAGEVYRDYGYARPDQADAFFTDRYGSMTDIPDGSYQSLLKTKRDIVNLQELDSGRAQQSRAIQQERRRPTPEPMLPGADPTQRSDVDELINRRVAQRRSQEETRPTSAIGRSRLRQLRGF